MASGARLGRHAALRFAHAPVIACIGADALHASGPGFEEGEGRLYSEISRDL